MNYIKPAVGDESEGRHGGLKLEYGSPGARCIQRLVAIGDGIKLNCQIQTFKPAAIYNT
jgi:hypothetical protein